MRNLRSKRNSLADRYEPTAVGIERMLRDHIRGVTNAAVYELAEPGRFLVLIQLSCWAWLTFGWYHWRANDRANKLLHQHAAAGTVGKAVIVL